MRTVIHHRPPSGERHIVPPNYAYGFSRWLKKTTGRTLCPPHRHIIEHLERTRLNAEPVPGTPRPWRYRPYTPARIIIADPAPGYTHIADLLVHYIHWLRTVILPHRRTLILDRTATAARALVTSLPSSTKASKMRINCSSITSAARHGETTTFPNRASERPINSSRATTTPPAKLHAVGSGCRPATHRGGTFDIILLLNADTYPTTRHHRTGQPTFVPRPDALDSALDTFLPMLQPHRESILIIHGTPYPRPARRRTPRRRTLRRYPSLTPSLNSLNSLNSLSTLSTSSAPPCYNPTPFLHYLTASLDGDLGPFTTIDPSPHPSTAAPCNTPSGDTPSQRDSDNERTPCFSAMQLK